MVLRKSSIELDSEITTRLRQLSDGNFDKFYLTVLDIFNELEMVEDNVILLKKAFDHVSDYFKGWNPLNPNLNQEYRSEVLNKLWQWGFIQNPLVDDVPAMAMHHDDSYESKFRIAVNIEKLECLRSFLESVRAERKLAPPIGPMVSATNKEHFSQLSPQPTSHMLKKHKDLIDKKYEVRYTPAQEVFINDTKIASADFNGENDNIFSYLIKHPNQTISPDELSKALGGKAPKKRLRKVVENLGFRGQYQKAFFSISKAGILFRNPVTQTMLNELGIKRLRLPIK